MTSKKHKPIKKKDLMGKKGKIYQCWGGKGEKKTADKSSTQKIPSKKGADRQENQEAQHNDNKHKLSGGFKKIAS